MIEVRPIANSRQAGLRVKLVVLPHGLEASARGSCSAGWNWRLKLMNYRNTAIALLVALLLGGLVWFLPPLLQDHTDGRLPHPPSSTYCPPLPVDGGEGTDRWLACRDLAAQDSMAASTRSVALFTLVQLVVGTATIVGLFWTISQGAASGRHAREALAHARDFGMVQSRAYVSAESYTITQTKPGFWRVSLEVRNRGQTPANDVEIRLVAVPIRNVEREQAWLEVEIRDAVPHRGIIGPGGSMVPGLGRNYQAEFLSAAFDQKAAIHVMAEVLYSDVFGARYKRRTSMLWTGDAFFKQFPTASFNDETTTKAARSGPSTIA